MSESPAAGPSPTAAPPPPPPRASILSPHDPAGRALGEPGGSGLALPDLGPHAPPLPSGSGSLSPDGRAGGAGRGPAPVRCLVGPRGWRDTEVPAPATPRAYCDCWDRVSAAFPGTVLCKRSGSLCNFQDSQAREAHLD